MRKKLTAYENTFWSKTLYNKMRKVGDGMAMKDSNGNIIPDDVLKSALKEIAEKYRATALAIRNGPYAGHVTEEMKDDIYKRSLIHADEIENGKASSLWLWQQVNFIVTGQCIALLP